MNQGSIQRVVIVGGGTAGWLSACYLAARRPELAVTLIESPDIPTIGVGEGTWPTMRETLAVIGIGEADFLSACDASFKQGSRFDGWVTGDAGDSYLHPFTLPPQTDIADLLRAWQTKPKAVSFAQAMTPQAAVCAANLAPRQRAMPEFSGALSYAYHLDAGKFAALLARHGTQSLGVKHVRAEVEGPIVSSNGDIAALRLSDGIELAGDLFLDCTGQAGLLIEHHCNGGWIDRSDVSFNDRALAVQVPVSADSPVASVTVGTAHKAGWLWDIALPTRRGIGCVYSSRFLSDEEAIVVLREYVSKHVPGANTGELNPRRLAFRTGHRERFWCGNCLAVGLSAGFIEPLEASAIVLIELSLRALADDFPADRSVMDIQARRFNALFRERWDRIVEFLKLHYVLSDRREPYWLAQRDPATVPPRLAENLDLWRNRPPSWRDFPQVEEIFPAASQQYVLYGMGFAVRPETVDAPSTASLTRLAEIQERARTLVAMLPENRIYLNVVASEAIEPAKRIA